MGIAPTTYHNCSRAREKIQWALELEGVGSGKHYVLGMNVTAQGSDETAKGERLDATKKTHTTTTHRHLNLMGLKGNEGNAESNIGRMSREPGGSRGIVIGAPRKKVPIIWCFNVSKGEVEKSLEGIPVNYWILHRA